jgi:transposase-like protein
MKKTRQRYDRAFKISVVAELKSGKPLAQIAPNRGFIRVSHLERDIKCIANLGGVDAGRFFVRFNITR